jgi:hypothetical protein
LPAVSVPEPVCTFTAAPAPRTNEGNVNTCDALSRSVQPVRTFREPVVLAMRTHSASKLLLVPVSGPGASK